MKKKSITDSIVLDLLGNAVLLFGVVIMLGPFVWMILSSFKTQTEILSITPTLFPQEATFVHYEKILSNVPIFKYYANSLIVSCVSTVALVISSVAVGYVLAKFQFFLKNVVFSIVLATMMLPFSIIMIPLFLEMSVIGFDDTLAGLILPFLCSGTGIFLMRQSLFGFPNELREAGIMDGCSEFRVLWQIVVPVNKPMISSLTILMFMTTWDGYLWPMLLMQTKAKYTLPLGLATLNIANQTDYGVLMAGATICVVPIVIVFLIMQKNFIEALAMSGIKG